MQTPASVLVVCPRRIGDVLLSTPVIRSARLAWPQARVDVLVFTGTEGVLQGNPDISNVIAVRERTRWQERLGELRRLWRRYDLALSVIPSDRARIYGRAAGRHHAGMVDSGAKRTARWLLDDALVFDDLSTHTVNMGLGLMQMLDVPLRREVVPPTAGGGLPDGVIAPFAVLHPFPKFNYKLWHEEGWTSLSSALKARGFQIVLTGSADSDEMAYTGRIAQASGALNLAGALSLGQAADLLRQASLYIGPDTAMTHIAAATGIPSVALFGPSNPVKWGPWPVNWDAAVSPWATVGSARQGNVALIQGTGSCVPCRQEGCDRHVESYSDCLQKMPATRVIDVAMEMLRENYSRPTDLLHS